MEFSLATLTKTARLEAGEGNVVVLPCDDVTAYSMCNEHGARIYVPLTDKGNPRYRTLVRGFIDHEVGHVRFTDFSVMDMQSYLTNLPPLDHANILLARGKQELGRNLFQGFTNPTLAGVAHAVALYALIFRGVTETTAQDSFMQFGNNFIRCVWNIIEDVWIERKMAAMFPGARVNLKRIEHVLFVDEAPKMSSILRNQVHTLRLDIATATFVEYLFGAVQEWLLYRMRGESSEHVRGVFEQVIDPPMQAAYPAMHKAMVDVLDNMWTCTHSVHNWEVALCIMDAVLRNMPIPNDYRNRSRLLNRAKDRNPQEQPSGAQRQQLEDMSDEASHSLKDYDKGNAASMGDTDVTQRLAGAIRDALEDAAVGKEDLLSANSVSVVANFDDTGRNDVRRIASHEVMTRSRAIAAGLGAQLRGLLQTWTMGRQGLGRRGPVDTRNLYRLSVNDDRVFTRRTEVRGVNTEVIVMVDESGSMLSKYKRATEATFGLLKALHGIPGVHAMAMGFDLQVRPYVGWDEVVTCKHGESLTLGGTDIGAACMRAYTLFRKEDSRKVVIVITDGIDMDCARTARTIRQGKDILGIETLGLAIGDTTLNVLSDVFGSNFIRVDDARKIPRPLFALMRKSLVEGGL